MTITRLGIVGSGIMGSGIAEVAAKAGMDVVLRSRRQDTADAMVASLTKSLARQVEKGRLDQSVADEVLGRVSATSELEALGGCDLILESVVEDLLVKKELFAQLDAIAEPGALAGHEHLHASGRRVGRRHRAPRGGLRHPLLQPGAGDVAGGGDPAAHGF